MENEIGVNRVQPNDIIAEQAVLGSMLVDKDAVISAVELLKAEDFYREDNKEIYEGDILNINGSIFEVRFSCGVFGFIPHGSIDDEMSNCLRKGFASVIGNIYDNPELLEGGEK